MARIFTFSYFVEIVFISLLTVQSIFNCTSDTLALSADPRHTLNLTRLAIACKRAILDDAPVPTRMCKQLASPLVGAVSQSKPANESVCDACLPACALSHAVLARGEPVLSMRSCSRVAYFVNKALSIAITHFNSTTERIQYGKISDSIQHSCLAEARRTISDWPAVSVLPKKTKPMKLKSSRTVLYLHHPSSASAASASLWACWAQKQGLAFVRDEETIEWLRWQRMRELLDKYDVVISVNGENQVVSPSCWNMDALRIVQNMYSKYHILMRDVLPPQTVRTDLLILRSSEISKWVVDRVLDQRSFGVERQKPSEAAFIESVILLLELETREKIPDPNKTGIKDFIVAPTGEGGRMYMLQPIAEQKRTPYRSDCFLATFNADDTEISRCFWYWSNELAGSPGARNSQVVGFVDPRIIDVASPNQVGFIIHTTPAMEEFLADRVPAGTCESLDSAFENLGTCVANNEETGRGYCAPYLGVC